MNKKIIIIAGPTASGKTSFGIKLAKKLNGEIINADSLQVYLENPILSAQPTSSEREDIPHHLFGYIKGDEEYTVARWIKECCAKINSLKKLPILVGGSGFYIKHLMFGLSSIPDTNPEIREEARLLVKKIGSMAFYKIFAELDPVSATRIDPNNIQRVLRAYEVLKSTGKPIYYWQNHNIINFPLSCFKLIILQPEREILYNNCNQRFLDMLKLGAEEEVKYLLKKQYNPISGIMKTHGIPELSSYLLKEITMEQAINKSQQVVRNYAKRQTTWFKHQFNHADTRPYFISNPIEEFDRTLLICQKFIED